MKETEHLKVYLETPIEIRGIKITHTKEGLKYLIEHWTNMPRKNEMSEKNRKHLELLITNWKQHLALYESQEGK